MYRGLESWPGPCIVLGGQAGAVGRDLAFVAVGFPSRMPNSIEMRKLFLPGSQT